MIPSFVFGGQYGGSLGLFIDGRFVAYQTTLGPGSRIIELSSALYFISFLATVLTD